MTINVMENIRKIMGWCPNANALATKRVMVALPEGEDFFTDEKGKSGVNMSKMGWGNKFRNIVLLMTLISFAFLGYLMLFLLFIHEYSGFVEYFQNSLLKGIITSIILAVFILADQWRHLNRINEGKNVLETKKEFAVMALFFAGFMFLYTIKAYDFLLVVMFSTGFIISLINYPMTIYWERKNRKTIYLVEEKLLRWRPVALSVQAP
jgi:hypothetical protein